MKFKLFTINLLINFINTHGMDYCALECVYSGGTFQNSACDCSIGDHCGEDFEPLPPDKETKDYIVSIHNEYRERIASGISNPPASNMVALVYDDDLEHVAQCYANKCIDDHDRCRKTKYFESAGQNCYVLRKSDICDDKEVFNRALKAWFSEEKLADENCMNSYSGCNGAEHFTQIIWAETTSVGCGRIEFGETCHVFCNYGPAGNMRGAPVYKQGSSTCQTEQKYPHLCKTETSPFSEDQGNKDQENKDSSSPMKNISIKTVGFFLFMLFYNR